MVHSSLLEFYSRIGCKVDNIKQVLSFRQIDFLEVLDLTLLKLHSYTLYLKDWVGMNTRGRTAAQLAGNELKRAFFKLMVNSVYGKFSENLLNQTNMSIVTSMEDLEKSLHSPYYKSHSIISHSTMLVEEHKPTIILDRPAQIGISILELSKKTMYNFFYTEIREKFGDRAEAVYTDTDSLIIRLRTKNVDEDLKMISSSLDTSNFPSDHELFSNERAAKLGFFKSEVGSEKIHVACSIRSKCYSLNVGDTFAKQNKLKGVNRDAVAQLTLSNYLRTILLGETQTATFNKISSRKHNLYVDKVEKRSLASYDDKVQLKLCGIHSRKYGASFSNYCNCPFSKIC